MTSFNHAILTADQVRKHFGYELAALHDGCTHGGRLNRCGRPVRYLCRFEYVTGRRGRITDRRYWFCAEHAEQWAKRHQVPLPAQAVQP